MNINRRTVLAGAGGAVLLAALPGVARAADIEAKDIPFGGFGQKLDAYWTDDSTPKPWVMVVHGGSWMGGDKSDPNFTESVARFREQGYNVFVVNYRLSPVAAWPAQRDDVYAALRHVRTHAAEWNIDPDRGALYGESAGAHIAFNTAIKMGQVKAVVGVSGIYQPLAIWQYGHGLYLPPGYVLNNTIRYLADWAVVLFNGPPKPGFPTLYSRWYDGTSQNFVTPQSPAMLMFHSSDDIGVPYQQADNFEAAAKGVGADCTLYSTTGAHHDAHGVLFGSPTQLGRLWPWLKARTG